MKYPLMLSLVKEDMRDEDILPIFKIKNKRKKETYLGLAKNS